MLLRDLREVFRSELSGLYPPDEIDTLFHILLEHYLDLPRFVLALEPRRSLVAHEESPLFSALDKLKQNIPVQYITGVAPFMDMDLRVGPDVLIPRPETEELVRWVASEAAPSGQPLRILDLGTGSGCIAIALAKSLPGSEVTGLDISEKALACARENARIQEVGVRFETGDLAGVPDIGLQFDILVSNPPYIPLSESETLPPHVRGQEPANALFVPGEDPLWPYRRIAEWADRCLQPGGRVFVEIHERFGPEVGGIFEAAGMREVRVKKDIFGKDRMVSGRKPQVEHD